MAYYQQVGRAGRALETAYGVLLSGEEETEITDYFINTAFPSREDVQEILGQLGTQATGLTKPELLSRLNISSGKVNKTLDLLSLESPAPITKTGTRWQLTAANLRESFWQRAERLTALRREEQRQMQEYVRLEGGHMQYLLVALDGDPRGVTPSRLPPLLTAVDTALVREAEQFLRRTSLPIEPRKTWPGGGLPRYNASGRIPEEMRAKPGRALCTWGDAGWGTLVRHGKYRDGRFADELVVACAALVRDWNPDPAPEWVTCVPSLRHPELVPDFARRLAAALGLPFAIALQKSENRPEQKTMANSAQQARNVDGSLAVIAGQVRSAPVLLVDDMVDSRWTLTVAAWLLLQQSSGPVWPLALAFAGHDMND